MTTERIFLIERLNPVTNWGGEEVPEAWFYLDCETWPAELEWTSGDLGRSYFLKEPSGSAIQ